MKIFFSALLFAFTVQLCMAQEAEFIIPKGHSNKINVAKFSPDMKFIATGSGEYIKGKSEGDAVKIWDTQLGRELLDFGGYNSPVVDIAFSSDSKWIASASEEGKVIIWGIEDESERFTFNTGDKLHSVLISAADKYIITIGDKLRFWSAANGKEINAEELGYTPLGNAYDKSSDLLAISGQNGMINFYRFTKPLQKSELFSLSCSAVCFKGASELLAYGTDRNLSGQLTYSIKSYDLKTGKITILKTLKNTDDSKVFFSPYAKYIAICDTSSVKIEQLTIVADKQPETMEINQADFLSFSPALDKVLISRSVQNNKADIIDLNTNLTEQILSGYAALATKVSFGHNDSLVMASFPDRNVNWNIKEGSAINQTISEEASIPAAKNSKRNKIENILLNYKYIVYAPDQKSVLVSKGETASPLVLFRISDGKELKSYPQLTAVNQFGFMKSKNYFITTSDDKTLRVWDIEKGSIVKTLRGHTDAVKLFCLSNDENSVATASLDNSIKIWDMATGNLRQTLNGHTQPISSISFSKNNKFLVSAAGDYSIRLWNIESGKELAKYYALENNDFMISNFEGYYMSSPGAARKLNFKFEDRIFNFTQFDLQFNRPDKVLETMGTVSGEIIQGYKRIYSKRLEKMGFDSQTFESDRSTNVPKAEILEKNNIPLKTNNRTFKLKINFKDEIFNLHCANVYVNGVPLHGTAGVALANRKTKNLLFEESINLGNGRNLIEVSVINSKGVESLKDEINVNFNGQKEKPNLYLISIGISKYANPKKNLNYASKDAEDIAKLFNEKRNDYGKVIQIDLLNEKVTKNNIIGIKSALQNSTVDDQVIVFYAGHGVVDEKLDYYLSTFDMDFSSPANGGLLYEDFENILDNIPARNKVLLIDACQSGEIDKSELKVADKRAISSEDLKFRAGNGNILVTKDDSSTNSFELMKQMFVDLRVSTGTTIISSAGASDYALESNVWNNGAFTYSVLLGLRNLNADINKNGKITVSELVRYVKEKVPELTDGMQTPVSRMENLANDIQIW